jgi:DNA uptake protein ComE-like DNA-binding protein
MWKNFVKDYLSFTKKDRVGVMVLVTLIGIVVLLPYLWPARKIIPPGKVEIEELRRQIAQLKQVDTAAAQPDDITFPSHYTSPKKYSKEKSTVFYFDPNTLDAAGWKRLGIRDKTIATIQNYTAKGGRFRHPEDIGKIYGLFKDDYERLRPWVKIAGKDAVVPAEKEEQKVYAAADKRRYNEKRFATPAAIEINTADTAAFIALPGIGSKLAARIVNFREKLGGFYEVHQVAETYGLPDSTFNQIRPLLQCNRPAVKQININTADANELKQHPYIRWTLANLIIKYREQHGVFKSPDDLLQLATVTPELLGKIRPYITVGD